MTIVMRDGEEFDKFAGDAEESSDATSKLRGSQLQQCRHLGGEHPIAFGGQTGGGGSR